MAKTKFDLNEFLNFCSKLRIETKEHGTQTLAKLLGSQDYVIREIAKGLNEDIHFFVILKARQLGITTLTLALDLYWIFKHKGMQATLVSDTDGNKETFRTTLGMYMHSLPPEWKIPIVQHNRNQLTLKSKSRLFYQVAGTRGTGGLSRGKAIIMLHGTETSSWGSPEGLASLIASFAEQNPKRLFVFESTARGFEMFHDLWETAKRARTQRAIFCGWWRNELYSVPVKSDIHRVYWDGRLTAEEREWVNEIKKLYNVTINSRQMAWWRWKLAEEIKDDQLMVQEFPPTEEYAFIMTGTSYFSMTRCTDAYKAARKLAPDYYRYSIGANFTDLQVIKSTERLATLRVWQEPVEGAYYCIGADPSYGSSDYADRSSVQVLRCYSDKVEQVAEFASPELNTYQFAWVVAHLAGAYRPSILNLEVSGPGQAVIEELKKLRQQATVLGAEGKGLLNVLAAFSHYIWRRNDNMGGLSTSIGWKTNHETKKRMLSYFKDLFERGLMDVRSLELLDEMKTLRREDGDIRAAGRHKDDRVIAMALASAAYSEQLQLKLLQSGIKFKPNAPQIIPSVDNPTTRTVSNYLQQIRYHG